ncbi:cardiolipin synthase [Sphingomonas koreensis]|uniref:Cardiolipin synthase n=1 Tax=Sphingomonas koreensis TaxID=93064 RepID=A0A430FXP4_9SPHN|nr:cardiolipin synthase [Sphingomonas koreensis]
MARCSVLIVVPGLEWLLAGAPWAIRIGALIVVPFRRSPTATQSWLLLFFFAPWAALVLYLVIGRPAHPRWRRERVAQLWPIIGRAFGRINQVAAPVDLPLVQAATASLVSGIGQMPPLAGNAVEFLTDYDATLDRLVQDIDAATNHVHLLFYIFAADETGWKIIAALKRAASRGVECRVLVDAIGSRAWAKRLARELRTARVEVHEILPIRVLGRTTRFDLRNHRKIAVIDGRIGYTGSQNIIDADHGWGWPNREVMARVRGPVVGELQAVFVADWFLETDIELADGHLYPPAEHAGTSLAQVLPSGPDLEHGGIDELFVALIHSARERVLITTPYFIPSEALLQALQIAILRGVEVRLLLSGRSDHPLVHLAQQSYYSELLSAGAVIHLFQPGFLHAKHMSIDEAVAVVGSSNVDMRSFALNSEISLVLYDREATLILRQIERSRLEQSVPLRASDWERRNLARKCAENVARLFSPLL